MTRTGRLIELVAAIVAAVLMTARDARAWLFIEHTEIGRTALKGPAIDSSVFPRSGVPEMSAPRLLALERAWKPLLADEKARQGINLCESIGVAPRAIEVPPVPGELPFDDCIDLPAMAAFAGDHSCSASDLVDALRKDWAGELVREFSKNYEAIRWQAIDSPKRTSLWHAGHLAAQRIDAAYLSRAQQNGSHFVLPRLAALDAPDTVREYTIRMSSLGAPTNAIGLYVAYHAKALRAAAGAHCDEDKEACVAPTAAREAILFEAVALHFLEDALSAGHFIGGPHDTSRASRMGTHDHYCTAGITAVTWAPESFTYSAHGDAHLMRVDRMRAAGVVRRSIEQLADALLGVLDVTGACDVAAPDVCTAPTLAQVDEKCIDRMLDVVMLLPAPPLEATLPPPFRNDVGAYGRFAFSVAGGVGWASAVSPPNAPAAQTAPYWGLSAGAGLGISLAGVTTSTSDSQAFLQVGLDATSGQRNEFCFTCNARQQPVGARIGVNFRARLPYWAAPGDFVPLGLSALFGSKWAFNQLVRSAEGGLYCRWQRVWPVARSATLQIVLGRDVGFSTYSSSQLLRKADPNALATSYAFAFPVVDLGVARFFSQHTSSSVKFTLAYRLEHSEERDTKANEITAHFVVLSMDSDSNLYFTGF